MNPTNFLFQDRTASICGLACFIGLGGFLLWAALVPMAEGVAVPGQIVVEDNRKLVQHLEGGIVKKLWVREGMVVRASQKLLELEEVQAKSTRGQIAQTVAALRGTLDRLEALSRQQALTFRTTQDLTVDPAILAAIRERETSLFQQQRAALAADVAVLGARSGTLVTDAQNKARQIDAVDQTLDVVRRQLSERRALLVQHLIRRDSVDDLEQEELRLTAELARLQAERGSSLGQAGQTRSEVAKANADFRRQIAADLVTTRTDLANAEEKLRAANDVLARTIIRAPQAGKILNLAFDTLGGVVKPGENILEIVPESGVVIARVSVRPNQRDAVSQGQQVKARLSINKSWAAPELTGTVLDISGDLKIIPQTGESFYEARVRLAAPPGGMEGVVILPGMPIEANINSGVSRTFLSYLIEPIQSVVRRSL